MVVAVADCAITTVEKWRCGTEEREWMDHRSWTRRIVGCKKRERQKVAGHRRREYRRVSSRRTAKYLCTYAVQPTYGSTICSLLAGTSLIQDPHQSTGIRYRLRETMLFYVPDTCQALQVGQTLVNDDVLCWLHHASRYRYMYTTACTTLYYVLYARAKEKISILSEVKHNSEPHIYFFLRYAIQFYSIDR